jgi:hypothetical protein
MDNSPKFYLDMIFMNVNLDVLTSMQKIEDTLKVPFGFDLIIKEDLNLNTNFEPGLHCSYTLVAM